MWQALSLFAACGQNRRLLGIFPTWYKYLNVGSEPDCDINIGSIYDIFKIAGAILEMLLAAGAILAVAFIIIGGIRFITSLGDPNGIKGARDTIINAVIGLVITLVATMVVSFIAGRF